MSKVKWVMVGTGFMADLIVPDLLATENTELVGFVSRSPDVIAGKMKAWGIDLPVYPTVETAIANPDIDLIYIGTPHSEHFPAAKKVLEAGKHCLVEKAMTMNQAEAIELAQIAREKKVFLMEAMWSKFNPLLNEIKRRVDSGEIGKVKLIQTNFGFNVPYDNSRRLFNKELGGGSVLDQGVYTISVASWFADSEVETIDARGEHFENGAESSAIVTLTFKNGVIAHACSAINISIGTEARIVGETGYFNIHGPFWSGDTVTKVTLRRNDQDSETFTVKNEGAGYIPMIRAVSKAVLEGKTETAERPLNESIYIMGLLDQIRSQIDSRHE
jgi:predicted dehydrogenase